MPLFLIDFIYTGGFKPFCEHPLTRSFHEGIIPSAKKKEGNKQTRFIIDRKRRAAGQGILRHAFSMNFDYELSENTSMPP